MISVVPGPAMKRYFFLDLRYVLNFVCDFSTLLTFPDAQAISKVTVIPYVAIIPLLPTRCWRYIFHYSALTILRKYSINIWRSLKKIKYSSRRGLARLFTSVHGHRHARWVFITFLWLSRSMADCLSAILWPGRRKKDGSCIYLFTASFRRLFTARAMSLFTVSLSVFWWEIGHFVFSGSEIETQH